MWNTKKKSINNGIKGQKNEMKENEVYFACFCFVVGIAWHIVNELCIMV